RHVRPERSPLPTSSVLNRKRGPSTWSAVNETESFSTEAGSSPRLPFWLKRVSPDRRSIAIAAVWLAAIPGARTARPRARSSAGAAAGDVVDAARAATATDAATRAAQDRVTDECVADGADGAGPSAVDGDGDGSPAPFPRLGGRGEPEVDDAALDRV